MTIRHHATDETLLRYAAGQLPAGPARILAVHLSGCPVCRERVCAFEAVGGALLDEIAPVPMSPDAFAAALRAIDQGETSPAGSGMAGLPVSRARRSAQLPEGLAMPEALRDCDIGPWRWIGIGMRASTITLPEDPKASMMLLRVGPGRQLPEHGHVGTEFTQILFGSFSDAYGRYMPGDLSEMGHEDEHQPVVDREGECICLVALDGGMRLTGVIGRLIQPFIRM